MQDGATALMVASANGHLEVARLLCEAGADKDKAMQDGATALILASANGHLEVARLLCEAGADKDKAMQDGATALILASANGHLEVARLLCEAGADKDKARQDGATALMAGVCKRAPGGGPTALRGWRRQGQGDAGWCHGLDLGVSNGHLEVARLLCEAGADKDDPTGNRQKEPKSMETVTH